MRVDNGFQTDSPILRDRGTQVGGEFDPAQAIGQAVQGGADWWGRDTDISASGRITNQFLDTMAGKNGLYPGLGIRANAVASAQQRGADRMSNMRDALGKIAGPAGSLLGSGISALFTNTAMNNEVANLDTRIVQNSVQQWVDPQSSPNSTARVETPAPIVKTATPAVDHPAIQSDSKAYPASTPNTANVSTSTETPTSESSVQTEEMPINDTSSSYIS